jgi:hypothetical protein
VHWCCCFQSNHKAVMNCELPVALTLALSNVRAIACHRVSPTTPTNATPLARFVVQAHSINLMWESRTSDDHLPAKVGTPHALSSQILGSEIALPDGCAPNLMQSHNRSHAQIG